MDVPTRFWVSIELLPSPLATIDLVTKYMYIYTSKLVHVYLYIKTGKLAPSIFLPNRTELCTVCAASSKDTAVAKALRYTNPLVVARSLILVIELSY